MYILHHVSLIYLSYFLYCRFSDFFSHSHETCLVGKFPLLQCSCTSMNSEYRLDLSFTAFTTCTRCSQAGNPYYSYMGRVPPSGHQEEVKIKKKENSRLQ